MTDQRKVFNMMKSALEENYEQVLFVDNEEMEGHILNIDNSRKTSLYDDWCKDYFKSSYAGDDIRIFLRNISYNFILDKLTYTKKYSLEYSVKVNGSIRRKRFVAFMIMKESILCVCLSDVTSDYIKVRNADSVAKRCLETAYNSSVAKERFYKEITCDLKEPVSNLQEMLRKASGVNGEDAEQCICAAQKELEKYSEMLNRLLMKSAIEKGQLDGDAEVVFVQQFIEECKMILPENSTECKIECLIENLNSDVDVFETDKMLCVRIIDYIMRLLVEVGSALEEKCTVKGLVDFDVRKSDIDEENVFDLIFTSGVYSEEGELTDFGEITETYADKLRMLQYMTDSLGGQMRQAEKMNGKEIILRIPVRHPDYADVKEAAEHMYLTELAKKSDFSDCHAIVADDDPVKRDVMIAKLQRYGMTVDVACDGQDVIDMLVGSQVGYYQILFMNPILPNKTGLEATMEIRELERQDLNDITIVALTSNPERDERIRALEHGMDYHVPLPIDEIELRDILLREIRNIDPGKEHDVLGFRVVK